MVRLGPPGRPSRQVFSVMVKRNRTLRCKILSQPIWDPLQIALLVCTSQDPDLHCWLFQCDSRADLHQYEVWHFGERTFHHVGHQQYVRDHYAVCGCKRTWLDSVSLELIESTHPKCPFSLCHPWVTSRSHHALWVRRASWIGLNTSTKSLKFSATIAFKI